MGGFDFSRVMNAYTAGCWYDPVTGSRSAFALDTVPLGEMIQPGKSNPSIGYIAGGVPQGAYVMHPLTGQPNERFPMLSMWETDADQQACMIVSTHPRWQTMEFESR